MAVHRASLAALSQLVAFATAVMGGAYFGLFACGGPNWRWRAYEALAGVLLVATLLLWRPARHRLAKALGFTAALAATFLMVQAMIGPLPWASPFSRTYWRQVLVTLEKGPC